MQHKLHRDSEDFLLEESLKGIVVPLFGKICAQYHSVNARTSYLHKSSYLCLHRKLSNRKKPTKKFQYLPTNIVPKHYKVEIKPNLQELTFKGVVSIEIRVKADTSIIILNAVDIKLRAAEVKFNCDVAKSKSISLSVEDETATIELDMVLPADTFGTLVITFCGKLNNSTMGFFWSKYLTDSGMEKYAAITQFETTNARHCFPCWDEPAIKATFDIVLIAPLEYDALSNMPIKKEELLGRGNRRIEFARTPIMPTYLVAFVVGEFDCITKECEDGVLIRVFTTLGKKEQAFFALEIATKMLSYFKSYYNAAFPLPKIDFIAVSDFSAGAMANWGLVICREDLILVDAERSLLMCKQSIALTLSHMIALQWFGNLVTIEWWTYLWLNEAYASFIKCLCISHLFPEYDIWMQFITDVYSRALELDSLRSSHLIEMTIGYPCEIFEKFDEISYNKGAAVMRMLHDYIGNKYFRQGIEIYLARHQYRNTCTEDLWAALQEASSKLVVEVMSSWMKFKGFPLVKVRSTQIGHKKRLLQLTQNKFFSNGLNPNDNSTWIIPISVLTSRNPQNVAKTFLMDKKSMEIVIKNVDKDDWIKLNAGTIGYYRTQYSQNMLERLSLAVDNMELHSLDRLGLLNDMFAVVQAGEDSMTQLLKLIASYSKETDCAVWTAVTNSLKILQVLISQTELLENFNKYCEKLYRPIADRLGWDEEPAENYFDKFLRNLVLESLVNFRCRDFVMEAQQRFQHHNDGTEPLPEDMILISYKAVLQDGNEEAYNKMLTKYRSTEQEKEEQRILKAFGCISNLMILKNVLKFALAGEVHPEGIVTLINSISANPRGRDFAWEFFRDNSQDFCEQCQDMSLFEQVIKSLIENFATDERAVEVEEFFKTKQFPNINRTVSTAVQTIRRNAAWLKRDQESLTNYLQQNYKTKI